MKIRELKSQNERSNLLCKASKKYLETSRILQSSSDEVEKLSSARARMCAGLLCDLGKSLMMGMCSKREGDKRFLSLHDYLMQ